MLHQKSIEALTPGQVIKDDTVPGLSLRRTESGWSWMLYYRNKAGVQRRPKLGEWPVIPVARARQIAQQWLSRVAGGEDPSLERKAARSDPTVKEAWSRCAQDHFAGGAAWAKEAKRLYYKNIDPSIGRLKIFAVGYDEAYGVHYALKVTPVEANRTLAVLSKLLNMAERWGHRPLNSNPCQRVERFKEKCRRRFATKAELAQIITLLAGVEKDSVDYPGAVFLQVMILSGARPSELLRTRPGMLTNGVLRIPEGKTGHRAVFLPPQALALLDTLPAHRLWLCDNPRMPRALWHRIQKQVGCKDLWIRDLRRTFATVALSHDMDKGKLGELLGHKSAQTTMIYARLMEGSAHQAVADVASHIMLAAYPAKADPP